MKAKLLKKLHKEYRWSFIDDKVIIFQDKFKLAHKYDSILEFMEAHALASYNFSSMSRWLWKKNHIKWKNKHKQIYNEFK